jgi:hypothetical protein
MNDTTEDLSGSPASAAEASEARWLLLFHQIPPDPAYLRVKIGRRLARIGAVGLKNSVYVLPLSDAALEDAHWVVQEISGGGGDATLCEARFIEGLTDREVERRFQAARDEDYAELGREARELAKTTRKPARPRHEGRAKLEADIARLEKRLEEIASIDFFQAPGREAAVGLVQALRARLAPDDEPEISAAEIESKDRYIHRTWVTRTGVHVDRIASAWLVRRFVDAAAKFKFVPAKGYKPRADEVRFDMFEAEFTHEGDRCTFEVLVERLSIRDAGVSAIAEIIHDIDLKDARYERSETPGVAAAIAGLCQVHREDDARLEHGFAVLDGLHRYFSRRKAW